MHKVLDLLDVKEMVKRFLKYFIIGIAIAIVTYVVPQKKLDVQEIGIIALSSATIFAVVDLLIPNIIPMVFNGLGLGIGLELAGLLI